MRAPRTSLAVAEMRNRENNWERLLVAVNRMFGQSVIDFVAAATSMLSAFAATLALFLAASVARPGQNLRPNDPLPVGRVIPGVDWHFGVSLLHVLCQLCQWHQFRIPSLPLAFEFFTL